MRWGLGNGRLNRKSALVLENRALNAEGKNFLDASRDERIFDHLRDLGSGIGDFSSGVEKGIHFGLGGTEFAADDGSSVAHALARRSGASGNEADDGFCHVLFDEGRTDFFVGSANFSDHDYGFRFGVFFKHAEGVDESGADDRVSADADAGGLSEVVLGEFPGDFVCEGARAGDHSDRAFLENVTGHDAHLALIGSDDSGAVSAEEDRFAVGFNFVDGAHHVVDGNPFGDQGDEGDSCIFGFENGISGEWRGDKDEGGVGPSGGDGFVHSVEDWTVEVGGAAFSGGDSGNDLRSVLDHLPSMETSFFSGHSGDDDFCIFVDQNRHGVFRLG